MPARVDAFAQLVQKRIRGLARVCKCLAGLDQALSNPLAQLGGGRFGEGHDQNLRR